MAAPSLDDSIELLPQICGYCEDRSASLHCDQCNAEFCKDCGASVHAKGFFKTHELVSVDAFRRRIVGRAASGASGALYCFTNTDEKLSFYCCDCRTSVCSHCLILGEHKGH